MLSQRLALALETGLFALPAEGAIAVFGPSADSDLSALPAERVEVITRHYPTYRHFADQGLATRLAPKGRYALSIVCLPRARAETEATIFAASQATTGPLIIDGQKTSGIESIRKSLRSRATVGESLAKAHGKIFAAEGISCADWAPRGQSFPSDIGEGAFVTAPGVFSADGIDPGSAALAEALPQTLKGEVIDLGAGWGYLSCHLATRPKITALHLVEADHAALEAARQNLADPRAMFHWADALAFRPGTLADHVVTNPPFHTGRAAEPALGRSFIRAAATMLKPKGQLWLVANRHLPYEKTLEETFRDVRALGQHREYKLFMAQAPRPSRKG